METYRTLEVRIGSECVGTLASYQRRLVAFEYAESWLRTGYTISPFSLPLQKKLYIPKQEPFDGLFGVFADSLPDGWGRKRHPLQRRRGSRNRPQNRHNSIRQNRHPDRGKTHRDGHPCRGKRDKCRWWRHFTEDRGRLAVLRKAR